MADTVVPLRPNMAPAESRKLPYSGRLPDPFSGVTIKVTGWSCLCFAYCATSDQELIACGAISAELLAKPPHATKVDELGNPVHISHRGGRCMVSRYREDDEKQNLPGFESWMVGALRQEMEKDKEARKCARSESQPQEGALDPEACRHRYAELVRHSMGDVVIAAAELVSNRLVTGYKTLDADRLAYRARAQAAIDELAGMISRLRIVRTDGGTSRLRLIVDNTRKEWP